jgi:hypothetical protein
MHALKLAPLAELVEPLPLLTDLLPQAAVTSATAARPVTKRIDLFTESPRVSASVADYPRWRTAGAIPVGPNEHD